MRHLFLLKIMHFRSIMGTDCEENIMEENNLEELHQEAMKKIENAKDIRELPAITKKVLLVKLKAHFDNDAIGDVNDSDMIEIADSLIRGEDINDNLLTTLKRLEVEEEDIEELYASIYDSIVQDTSLDIMVEEINAKNEKIAEIYTLRHEAIMKQLEDAKTLEDLPKNRTTSVLTNYLKANSSVYMDGVNFTSSDFAALTNILLSGKKIEFDDAKQYITNMVKEKYPEDGERISKLLIEKLKELPNIYNLVEEINKKNEKDAEFIEKGLKDVNIYYFPILNPLAPTDGGKNYVSYMNTGKVLAMDQLLPEINEKGLKEPRNIAAYIRDNYDSTFRISGSSILGRGYRIKSVYAGGELLSKQDESAEYVTISRKEYRDLLKAKEENEKYKAFYEKVSSAVKEVEEVNKEEDIDLYIEDDSKEEI